MLASISVAIPGSIPSPPSPSWEKKGHRRHPVDNLYNHNPITEEDLDFLSMFANQAGLAIENAILYRNLEEVHQELKETQSFWSI